MNIKLPTATIWVCVDCYMTHYNGAPSDDPDYTPDRPPLSLIGEDEDVTAGALVSEHASDCPARDEDPCEAECECERREFSWAPCQGCGSTLGGARQALTVWSDRPTMLDAYIECALWSSTDDEGTPLDSAHDASGLAAETRATMLHELGDFLALLAREGINWESHMSAEQFAHDFWLTRNHHGAGFWDRGLGDLGDQLTTWAQSMGSADLYVGDDGMIYQG